MMSEFPESWMAIALSDAVINIAITDKKIPQKEYLSEGTYPIFDQGQDYIGGYSDKKEKLVDCELPVIVFGDHTRVVKFVNQPFAPGADGIKVLQPQHFYHPRLLEYFACHIVTHLTNHGYARHYQHLAKSTIPLPPFNEQHRIVAKIEELFSELDKGIENLKTTRAQLKVYRQALLKHAFDGKLTAQWRAEQKAKGKLSSVDEALQQIKPIPRPNRWKTRTKDTIVGHSVLAVGNPETLLPEGWRWVPMVDIARMESGHTPSRNHPEWWGGDVPWISIPDARKNHGRIIADTVQKTNLLGLENSAARLLPASTVCVSRTASVGYVVELGKPMATSQDFVNWTPSEAVRPEWLRLIFGADREALLKFGKGTTHQTIYFPEWLSVHIGLPSIEEQIKIIAEVESRLSVLDQLDQTITTSLQQAEALRQSILKKAFSGQLVPQDPHDESAAALLARIRAEKDAQSAAPRKTGKGKA